MKTSQSSGHTKKIETLKEFYAALNRNDIPAAVSLLDPKIVRLEPGDTRAYRGHAELQALWSQSRGNWAEGSCTPEDFMTFSDRIAVFVHVRVRLKDKTEWIDAHIADAFAFKNGEITEFRTFIEKQEALDWAKGVKMNPNPISKRTLWIGRVLSGLAVLFLLFDGIMKFFMDKLPPEAIEAGAALQWPIEKMPLVGTILLICLLLHLIPRTSIVGAVLLTGYLGGAIASHVRVGNPLFTHTLFPIYFGVLIWLGLYLRDARTREIFKFY